jgi:hypothetical protein
MEQVGEGFTFCFDESAPERYNGSWITKVYIAHEEDIEGDLKPGEGRFWPDWTREEALLKRISERDLQRLGIGPACQECCYEVEGETRREIKDRLEKAGFTYQPWGLGEEPGEKWRSYPDLDRLTVPEEPLEF